MSPPGDRPDGHVDLLSDVASIEDEMQRSLLASRRLDQINAATTQLAEWRLAGMLRMAEAGMTHSQIARHYHLTKARVGQILRAPNAAAHRAFISSGGDMVTVAIGGKLETGRPDGTDQPVLSAEAMAAYGVLADLVRSVGLEPTCEVVPPPGLVDLNRPNLLVLAGPRLLPFVGQVMAGDPWYGFDHDADGWFIVDKTNGQQYRSKRATGETVDYAYLGRLPRPDGAGNFLHLSGVHSTGTLGAATYLAEKLADLHRELRTKRFSTVLVCRSGPDGLGIAEVAPVTAPRLHENT